MIRSIARSVRILVADDDTDVLTALKVLLRAEGWEVETATSPALVLAALEQRDFDVTLLDLNYARDTTSGHEGLELLELIRARDATLPVVVMTAWASVEGAVAAVKRGARDYVQKPWENARLIQILHTQLELGQALRIGRRLELENQLLRREGAPLMVADAPAMRPVLDLIARVAPSDAHVLIKGEHGTGKELVARLLHAASARSGRPLVTVNMGGLSDSLFESEMFGHVKGSFTGATGDRAGRFELADGGTLFLDEVANVPMAQQAKLLRVLQTGEMERVGASRTRHTDVRLLSATNADLGEEVRQGRFREDLLFRLNTVEIHLPALRERREDIPALARLFLSRHAKRYRKNLEGFDQEAIQGLLAHPWPGNVRELDHAVERAVLMARDRLVHSADLGLRPPSDAAAPRMEELTLDEVERVLIQRAIQKHQGNVSEAAKTLGLSRSALYRRLERHGL